MKHFNFLRLTIYLCFTTLFACSGLNAQNSFNRFYIKLSPKLNFSSSNEALNNTNLKSLQNNYNFQINDAYSMSRAKIEILSKASKSGFTLKNTFAIEAYLNNNQIPFLLEALKQLPDVIYAYQDNVSPILPPNDIAPATSNYEANQGYLESNPGLNIRYAWDLGYTGQNTHIKDVEYGLNFNHEELNDQNASVDPNYTINSSASEAYTEHGTAVCGIMYSDKGAYGISGIAHGAESLILYPEWTEESDYNRTLAVSNAINASVIGDIIVYEMQTPGQNDQFVCAEYSQVIWDLTKAATDAGIIVVAAAGNGGEDLDDPFYNDYNARGDSGAIIVGAGSANTQHNKLSFSTYGNRVNVQGWGESVWSTGKYGGSILVGNDFNQSYYASFNGTSSATATIGGFASVLQSYYFDQSGSYLSSTDMRQIMINTGIPQGTGGQIGPLPNMTTAMAEIDFILSTKDFSTLNFNISPNPSKGIININFTQTPSVKTKIDIYSILGKKVYTSLLKDKRNQINLSQLQKGIYILVLGDKITKKLIIN
jgi:hypothetical protein